MCGEKTTMTTTATPERGGALGFLDDVGAFLGGAKKTAFHLFDSARGVVDSTVGLIESAVQFDAARGTVTVGNPAGVAERQAAVKAAEAKQADGLDMGLVLLLLAGAGLAFVLLRR